MGDLERIIARLGRTDEPNPCPGGFGFAARGDLTGEQWATVEPLLSRLHSAFLAVAREPCDAIARYGKCRLVPGEILSGRITGLLEFCFIFASTASRPTRERLSGNREQERRYSRSSETWRDDSAGVTRSAAPEMKPAAGVCRVMDKKQHTKHAWRYPCHEYSRSAPPLASLSQPRPDPRWPRRQSFTRPQRPQRSSPARSPITTATMMATATASATSVHDTYPRVR